MSCPQPVRKPGGHGDQYGWRALAPKSELGDTEDNPYAAYEGGGAVSILSGGRGKLEGKYHLIADRVSASETKHARNVEPQ